VTLNPIAAASVRVLNTVFIINPRVIYAFC
jgi:hypothetical protein